MKKKKKRRGKSGRNPKKLMSRNDITEEKSDHLMPLEDGGEDVMA